jgi:glyceraldehyde-3-phosphate dehydrogenase (NADP+)
VLPIVRVPSVEAAVAHVNANRLALQGCVFTRDVNKAMYISDAMETGSVQVGGVAGCGWLGVGGGRMGGQRGDVQL